MWWEYVIVIAGLALAAAYCLWLIHRLFSSRGAGCGSSACRCGNGADESEAQRGVKVVPLVELRTPGESRPPHS